MARLRRTGLVLMVLCMIPPAAGPAAPAADKLMVFVSIQPQQYFVRMIAGQRVDVRTMVAPGANPATYEPKPRQMAALAHAQLYFAIGVPFEGAWLPRLAAANPAMRIVPTDQGITKRSMQAHRHGHHNDGHHDTAFLDPHIWLSPPLVKQQAAHYLEALSALDPAHRRVYETRHARFMETLDRLHTDLQRLLRPCRGKVFMVFHPSWGYFADTYDLVQVPIEIEGKAPKPAQLQVLIAQARSRGIKAIFTQPQFSSKSAAVIARAIDGRVVAADPLASDWERNLRRVAEQIKTALAAE